MKGLYITYFDDFPKESKTTELFLHKEHTITDTKNILKKAYLDARKYNTDDNFLELIAINSDCEFSFIPTKKKDRKLFRHNHDWDYELTIRRNWGNQDIERIDREGYNGQPINKLMLKHHVYRFKSLLDIDVRYSGVKKEYKNPKLTLLYDIPIQKSINIEVFINQ
jgi:hypothetical protein